MSCLGPVKLPQYPMIEHHVVTEYVLDKGQFVSTKASQFKSSSIASRLNKYRYMRLVKPSYASPPRIFKQSHISEKGPACDTKKCGQAPRKPVGNC